MPAFGNTVTSSGGHAGTLAGTIATDGGDYTNSWRRWNYSYWPGSHQSINDFLDNLAAQQYLKMHNHKEETCDGCGCVCPCECPDCDVCSCGA